MPFPKKLLNDNETVVLDLHPHWWYFAKPVLVLVVAIALGIFALTQDDTFGDVLKWSSLILLVASAAWLVHRYLKWATTNFVITSERVIYRSGVLAKSGIEIPLERVNNVLFGQSMFERMIGAGDLLIESGGEGGQQRFTDIRNPERTKNLIQSQITEAKRFGAQPQPGVITDVATQLEKLEGMVERGTLSPEEFEAQKRKLLGA
jgi:uncharacterized membrane protein YdbT with pleckstrin-like domain